MKYLIIYAHPNEESLNYSLLKEVENNLKNKDQANIKIIDLYKDQFNPSLVFNKEIKRRDLHKDPEIEKYKDLINWADHLIFVYPIWWGRGPAILMGFIDRVFASGIAYQFKPGQLLPKGLLSGKKADIIATMKGPALFMRFAFGDTHRKVLGNQILRFCGIKKIRFFDIGNAEKMNNQRFSQIQKKLKRMYT